MQRQLTNVLGKGGFANLFGGGFGQPQAISTPKIDPTTPLIKQASQTKESSFTAVKKDGLPEIGSYDLIKDLVEEYNTNANFFVKEKAKQDGNSLRLFPGTKVATNKNLARDKEAWQERRSRSVSTWATQSTTIKTTLFNKNGIREERGTQGRFLTSTKPWLEGYETKKNKYFQSTRNSFGADSRMSTTTGQAMFNVKRKILPIGDYKADGNLNIRQNSIIMNPFASTKKLSDGKSNINSHPKQQLFDGFNSTR